MKNLLELIAKIKIKILKNINYVSLRDMLLLIQCFVFILSYLGQVP
jgi:hypothetical protein